MSRSFKRHGNHVRMELDSWEADLLRTVRDGVRELLESPDHSDPAIGRLFPNAVVDDDIVDIEVRNLIYDDLLAARLQALDEVVAILDRASTHRGRLRTDLDDEEANLVLGVLNDLRLTLGARIGIERLDRGEVDEDHPAAWSLAVMDHFAWWQEQLLQVLDPSSVSHYDEGHDLDD